MKTSILSLAVLSLLQNHASALIAGRDPALHQPVATKTTQVLSPRGASTDIALSNCRSVSSICDCDGGIQVDAYTTVVSSTSHVVCNGYPYPTVAPLEAVVPTVVVGNSIQKRGFDFGVYQPLHSDVPVKRGDAGWRKWVEKGEIGWGRIQAALADPNHNDRIPLCVNPDDPDQQFLAAQLPKKAISRGLRNAVVDFGIQEKRGTDSEPEYYHVKAKWPKTGDTLASFGNAFSPVFGVISADANDKFGKGSSIDIPAWSSVVWPYWKMFCEETNKPVDGLKWIIRHNIKNKFTQGVLDLVGGDGSRTVHLPGTEEFNALLGSPNGIGTAWILIDNKNALGAKNIKSVSTLTSGDEWEMIFELE